MLAKPHCPALRYTWSSYEIANGQMTGCLRDRIAQVYGPFSPLGLDIRAGGEKNPFALDNNPLFRCVFPLLLNGTSCPNSARLQPRHAVTHTAKRVFRFWTLAWWLMVIVLDRNLSCPFEALILSLRRLNTFHLWALAVCQPSSAVSSEQLTCGGDWRR